MKKRFFIFSLLVIVGLLSWASDDEIVLNCPGHQHDHGEYYPPADMPEAYFDSDEMEIIIEADGYADYYIVEVFSMVSTQSIIYTQIDGYGDTIDVSLLPDGYYQLVITSSNNNVFEGFFMIETE